jgi:hemerythrin-like domain-containing protein
MRWVDLIPAVLRVADVASTEDRRLLREGLDFIRSYADRFHHAKEEDVLFAHFDQTQEIIRVMLADHETARAHVREADAAIERQDAEELERHLEAYGRLLTEHIQKEDAILYPWMDRQLSTQQVGQLFSRFTEIDAAADALTGENFGRHYSGLVDRIEELVRSKKSVDLKEREVLR